MLQTFQCWTSPPLQTAALMPGCRWTSLRTFCLPAHLVLPLTFTASTTPSTQVTLILSPRSRTLRVLSHRPVARHMAIAHSTDDTTHPLNLSSSSQTVTVTSPLELHQTESQVPPAPALLGGCGSGFPLQTTVARHLPRFGSCLRHLMNPHGSSPSCWLASHMGHKPASQINRPSNLHSHNLPQTILLSGTRSRKIL